MCRCFRVEHLGVVLAIAIGSRNSFAQTAKPSPAPTATESTAEIVVPDEPRTIDPATLVPERLAQKATVEFTDVSLYDVVQWLREEQRISVIVEEKALEEAGIALTEALSDRLNDEPLYLLLNRLYAGHVGWSFDGNVLRLTTRDVADEIVRTQPFPIGDLLDAGFDRDNLMDTVRSCTRAAWEEVDGQGGSLQVLGDVLFARNEEKVLLKVAALLSALRQHGRRTYVFDDPQHFAIREKLAANISVDVSNAPLDQVLADLADRSEIDVRLESEALRAAKVREREPVSVTLAGQPLRTVLSAVLSPLDLSWVLRDRVLWITTGTEVDDAKKAAVYDVRDLCRDESERDALRAALAEQTGVADAIKFPRPGTMVILTTEAEHDEILQLLEAYRVALRQSKRRVRPEEDPDAVITRYYRLQSRIAQDLVQWLPKLIKPGTWIDNDHPMASGSILSLASGTGLLDASGNAVVSGGEPGEQEESSLVVTHSVLIIQQTRAAHTEIAELIEKIEKGDQPEGLGGGFGGGGFGGGLFSRPDAEQK